VEEAEDAVSVLRGAGLPPVAVQRLLQAIEKLQRAFNEHNRQRRELLVDLAGAAEAAARVDMVQ
jgi:ABC-type nitrate/sulfonate/bicarbonate transport system substrate-binding protein